MSGLRLARLVPEARAFVLTPEFVRGERAYDPDELAQWCDDADEDVDLEPFVASVEEVLASAEPGTAKVDALAAPKIHRALPISRRTAADPGIWRFLAVGVAPGLVRHRWPVRTLATTRRRFWAPGMRHDSNTIGRLWWIAELTRNGDDYGLTRSVLESSNLATLLFVRRIGHHRPIVAGFVRFFARADAPAVEPLVARFSAVASTCALDALDADTVVAILSDLAFAGR
ncbi:MAG: hypothetical protein D6705_08570 [Deltaproteobacteria bacterium]|nr:MAG: hypothetical protein D6705_08570 [Deltaproteobacteria bacterium]